ncbi:MAG: S-layer homology domain-containing protein, partial [Acidobacteriota bacterium]|nr:S-layer homology domain-containing protein [Acidobacteriota bacterium]
AAGTLAAFAMDHGVTPEQVYRSSSLTSQLQLALLQQGDPIYWYDDLKPSSPSFTAAQFLAVKGIFGPDGKDLHFHPRDPVTREDLIIALARLLGMAPRASGASSSGNPSAKEIRTLTRSLIRRGLLPAGFSDARKMDQSIQWRDLEMASRKLRIARPFSSPSTNLDRSGFAVWLERVIR